MIRSEATWVDFQYEKLQEFCFGCSLSEHSIVECKSDTSREMMAATKFPYALVTRLADRVNSAVLAIWTLG
ncbi:Zinc knuckle CX2CX4HX4C [Parasponia andersonii]|uniref:Zinc knuckle CX2CX4HX4C n=1 Tax=Parasponia andersonii TaxID=3476 RepID=A0A2P5DZC0_PARAD|nr:Zinc knuckle CX2CX4HX4C [Parasponia andersonii]